MKVTSFALVWMWCFLKVSQFEHVLQMIVNMQGCIIFPLFLDSLSEAFIEDVTSLIVKGETSEAIKQNAIICSKWDGIFAPFRKCIFWGNPFEKKKHKKKTRWGSISWFHFNFPDWMEMKSSFFFVDILCCLFFLPKNDSVTFEI